MATNTTSTLSNNVTTVLNRAVELSFEPKMIFSQVAESKVHQNGVDAIPGNTVNFTIYDLVNPALDTLSETTDPTSVTLSNTQKSVTLLEKGNLVTTTQELKLTSFDNLDLTIPTLVGQNMGESTDLYARTVLDTQVGTDYVTYVGQTAKASLTSSNTITAAQVRAARLKLENANVPVDPRFGSYIAIIHPSVAYDLRTETGDAAWLRINEYADPASALRGEIGMFDGFRFIQTTNCLHEPNSGAPAQSATTASTGNAVGSATLDVTSATGIVANDSITITHAASGDSYTYAVVSVATNELTIGKATNKNGNPYRAAAVGLIEAAVAGDAVVEGVDVYTSYFMGNQALAYAYALRPEMVISGRGDTGLQRLSDVGWKALHGYGELRPEALHKVFSASSQGNNS